MATKNHEEITKNHIFIRNQGIQCRFELSYKKCWLY